MRRKNCPECQKRLPYAAYWCRSCGWSRRPQEAAPGTRAAASRAFRMALTVFSALVFLAVGRMVLTSEAVVDWYADFAFQRLPSMFSAVAPGASVGGAYNYCVKSTARQVRDRDAVETYPSLAESELTRVSEERFAVRSHFDQRLDSGDVLRRGYECEVSYERGRWVLHSLQIQDRESAVAVAVR
jgi:hypothetical protein